MQPVDISRSQRIPLLLELVNSINHFAEPQDLLEKFMETMRQAYGRRCILQLSTGGLGVGEYRILSLMTHDQCAESSPERPALDAQPVYSGGALGEMIATGAPNIWHNLDLRNDAVLGDQLAAYHSALACPIFENEMGINWAVVLAPEPEPFTSDHLEDMILRANLVGALVNNLETARKLISASIQIQGEIESISRIQQALLPERLPEIPGLRIAAHYRTFDRAGGDIYDIARLGDRMEKWQGGEDHRWTLLIGDVSGHGPAAAVVMAMFHAILHAYPARPAGPGEVLQFVNHHLCAKQIEHSFVTAFLAFYDPATRELTYARAGHDPPLLKEFPHRGKPLHLDAVGDVPLGIMPDVRYEEARVRLSPGQTLILYTDGITEAGRHGGAMFGVDGIENSLIACTGAPDCAIRHISEALEKYQGEMRPADDQTIVAIQVV